MEYERRPVVKVRHVWSMNGDLLLRLGMYAKLLYTRSFQKTKELNVHVRE